MKPFVDQRDIAASLEGKAKEIAAAAHLFARMPKFREQLHYALDQQIKDLVNTWDNLVDTWDDPDANKE